jgi:hypothetical protein
VINIVLYVKLLMERSEARCEEAEICGGDFCVNMFCDSQSAIYLTKDRMFHKRIKHIDAKCNYVRDMVVQSKLKLCKISTYDNPADSMTNLVPVKLKFNWYNCLAQVDVLRRKYFLCYSEDC